MNLHVGSRAIAFAVGGGVLAGVMSLLLHSSMRGPLELFPYALLALVFVACLRRVWGRAARLIVVFVGTVTMLLVLYAGVRFFDPHVSKIPLSGHVWRIGFILAVGAALSLTISQIAPRVPSRPYPFAIAMGFFGSATLWITLFTRRPILLPIELALLLVATGVYLHRQRIERFSQRFMVGLVVCTVMTGLACLFLVAVVNPWWAGRHAWEQLFQDGLLYVEIVAVSVVLAATTRPEAGGTHSAAGARQLSSEDPKR